jgi:hypothetical protein
MTAEIAEEPVRPVQDEDGPSEDAPFGYMTDPDTGLRRPKKRPGRRPKGARPPAGKTPSIEELQALGSLSEASEDTAPGAPPKGRRKSPAASESLPPFRAGVIAKGMNGLYRRAGRLIRIWDMEIGSAVIACTRAEDEDDTTVGEAWENLAKTNPRIRAFLMRLMQGGAWTGVFMAHLPIFMAIAMKDGIRERLPLPRLADALLTDEDEAGGGPVPSGLSQMMGGVSPEDMAQMMAVAQGMMGQMAAGVPRASNVPRREPEMPWPQEAPREHPAEQG